ncbi:MAG TPA: hemolysin family protein [Gemmatimonadaceae bacterium]|nr:hemolysin family protein [Gemmatimonadaceae bacterium]
MLDALIPTVIITLLILLNGFFVAAEFAIVGAPRPAIERRAAEGQRVARMVAKILNNAREQDRFIATAQLGITLASLGLGMYGEHLLASWIAGMLEGWDVGRWIAAHTVGSITAVVILTYFHIVVGEMVPKSIALQHSERAVLWITPVMRVVQWLSFPFVVALNGLGNAVLRLVGIHRDSHTTEHYRTPDDLAYLVHEAQEGGLLRSESARVVAELLDFGELTAGEVMVPRVRVVALQLGTSAQALRALLSESPFTRYPVCDGSVDRIVGMMHVKDILRCLPACTSLQREQIRPVPYVPATAAIDHVMSVMRQANAQMAVVLDEHGGTAGVLTSEDLFEEVVGDIGDDATKRLEVVRHRDGTVTAAGVARLEALGDAIGVELEHEMVDTVSGLVLSILGRPPRVGDRVVYDAIAIEVTAVEGLGVAQVRASLLV